MNKLFRFDFNNNSAVPYSGILCTLVPPISARYCVKNVFVDLTLVRNPLKH